MATTNREFIAAFLRERRPDLLPLLEQREPLSEDQKDALRDALANELLTREFDEQWEPTERGRQLERMIDEISSW